MGGQEHARRQGADRRGLRYLKGGEAFLFGAHISASIPPPPMSIRPTRNTASCCSVGANWIHMVGGRRTAWLHHRPARTVLERSPREARDRPAKARSSTTRATPKGPGLAARQGRIMRPAAAERRQRMKWWSRGESNPVHKSYVSRSTYVPRLCSRRALTRRAGKACSQPGSDSQNTPQTRVPLADERYPEPFASAQAGQGSAAIRQLEA